MSGNIVKRIGWPLVTKNALHKCSPITITIYHLLCSKASMAKGCSERQPLPCVRVASVRHKEIGWGFGTSTLF